MIKPSASIGLLRRASRTALTARIKNHTVC